MSAADVFGDVKLPAGTITRYAVRLQIRELIVGGIPSSPSVVRGWLKARMELEDQALTELVEKTLAERGDVAFTSTEDALDVLVADDQFSVNGFKRIPDTGELAYEGRCMKAAIKEWANSAFPGTEWPGKTLVSKGFRKGLMATLAERVFVAEPLIGLGVKEPSRVEERIKHVMTPQGPRSSINRVEVIERAEIGFTLKVHDDFLPRLAWSRIWQRGEDIGIGADRGRSDGQFDLIEFTRL